MIKTFKFAIWFLLLVALQVLLFNNFALFGATAFVYVFFLITFPTTVPVRIFMPLAFLLGLCVDLFSGSLGLHAAVTTLVAFARLLVLRFCISQEAAAVLERLSFEKLKSSFVLYSVILVVLHHFALYFFEAFSFHFFQIIIFKTLISSVLTLIMLFCFELLNLQKS